MKEVYHYTNYQEYLKEIESYKGDFYRIVMSNNVVIITFKDSGVFVACLQFLNTSKS